MPLFIAQIEWMGYRVNSYSQAHVIHVTPEAGYPHGRKALGMAQLWAQLRDQGAPGVLWLDPDIAGDLDDLSAMESAVSVSPGSMHTGLVKLWPASTGRDAWIWSHRSGTLGAPVATQDETAPCSYVSTGYLWTPAVLLDLAFPAHRGWQWAEVDVGLSEIALSRGIPASVVSGCRPKHLHF